GGQANVLKTLVVLSRRGCLEDNRETWPLFQPTQEGPISSMKQIAYRRGSDAVGSSTSSSRRTRASLRRGVILSCRTERMTTSSCPSSSGFRTKNSWCDALPFLALTCS